MKRIIVPTGYMGSGSSAVTDLVSEFDGVANDYKKNEFVFLHCPNGLFDLEDHLLIGNNAIKSDASIRIFYDQMKKIYDKPFWWVGNYKKIIGPEFMLETNKFIDSITQFRYNHFWYYHEEINFKMFLKLVIRKPIRFLSRNKLCNGKVLRYNDGMRVSFISKDDFYKNAKSYIYNILDIMAKGRETIMLDQLLVPFNLFRIDNYFGDELRVIVVDRDPRDVFILNKYIWGQKNVDVPFPLDVNDFCSFYKNMRNSEHECKSTKVLRIHFEDLVYNYEKMVKKIANFMDFNIKDHINPRTRFNPDISIKNTQIFNSDKKYNKEIKIIESELSEYLYKFPYRLINKIEDTDECED